MSRYDLSTTIGSRSEIMIHKLLAAGFSEEDIQYEMAGTDLRRHSRVCTAMSNPGACQRNREIKADPP